MASFALTLPTLVVSSLPCKTADHQEYRAVVLRLGRFVSLYTKNPQKNMHVTIQTVLNMLQRLFAVQVSLGQDEFQRLQMRR